MYIFLSILFFVQSTFFLFTFLTCCSILLIGGEKMQNRLKQIRKKLGCNQNEFAEKLGISVSNISSYESGRRNPSDAVINLICEKFSVNKEWLETGKGEMFIQKTENEKIAEFLADVLKAGEKDQRYRFIAAISELDENDWNTIQKLAEKLVKK